VQLFHWHLLTSRAREEERRYVDELGFALVARYGTLAGGHAAHGPERSWEELDELGFRHRLTELERDGVNVVVQPGRTEPPLVDHVGVLVGVDEFELVLGRAAERGRRIQQRGGKRTFVATGAGYRLELRTDRAEPSSPFEVELAADDPAAKLDALAALLGVPAGGDALTLGTGTLRFLPGGPSGRPRLAGELLRPR
jgi:hypothetical protein